MIFSIMFFFLCFLMGLMGWFLTIYGRSADPVHLTAMSGDLKNYCHLNRQQMCFFFNGILWWFNGIINWLVVWNMTFMTSPRVGMMIQSDEHIFQGGRYTTNQIGNMMCLPQAACHIFLVVPQTNPTNSRSETNIDLKPSHCKSYIHFCAILHHSFRTFATLEWLLGGSNVR